MPIKLIVDKTQPVDRLAVARELIATGASGSKRHGFDAIAAANRLLDEVIEAAPIESWSNHSSGLK